MLDAIAFKKMLYPQSHTKGHEEKQPFPVFHLRASSCGFVDEFSFS